MNEELTKEHIYAFLDNYFEQLREYCTRTTTLNQEKRIRDGAIIMMDTFIQDTTDFPEEMQVQYMTRIQNRFISTLRDYDRKWLWEVFNDFSKKVPEAMLN
jgi:hypothetical protein